MTQTGTKCWFLKEKPFLGTVPYASILHTSSNDIVQRAIQDFVVLRTRDPTMGPNAVKAERGRKRSVNGFVVSFNQHTLVTSIRTPVGPTKAATGKVKFIDTIATMLGQHTKDLYLHKDFLPLLRQFCSDSMWVAMMETCRLPYSHYFNDCSIRIRSTDDLNLFLVRQDARSAVREMLSRCP